MEYYEQLLPRISPYFFTPNLVRLVAFQQLIVSRIYQIKREDVRTRMGVDYVRELVSRVSKPADLISVMRAWRAFDLNLTCNAFRDPVVATHIRRTYCLIGTKHWDCHNCPRTACRENMIWDESFIGLDVDTPGRSKEIFGRYLDFFGERGIPAAFKVSSLKGFHVRIGLPAGAGTTPFDRNVYHWLVVHALKEAQLPVDDNSLDPVPILRAPFALHYKRLTPSLPVREGTIDEALAALESLEKMAPKERLIEAASLASSWKGEWTAKPAPASAFREDLSRWKERAEAAIFREPRHEVRGPTAASPRLRKGVQMTDEEAQEAELILIQEGREPALARRIVKGARSRPPKTGRPVQSEEVVLRRQSDVPEVVLNIAPPLLFLLVDNATMAELREMVGVEPVSIEPECTTTEQAMKMLFQQPRFFRRYGQRWSTKTAYIGGLYSASRFCAAADYVLSVKEQTPLERDSKVVEELDKALDRLDFGAVVAHVLGLDYCKDEGLPTDGAMLVLKRLVRLALETERNIVVTTDHTGEKTLPYFALLTRPAGRAEGSGGTP